MNTATHAHTHTRTDNTHPMCVRVCVRVCTRIHTLPHTYTHSHTHIHTHRRYRGQTQSTLSAASRSAPLASRADTTFVFPFSLARCSAVLPCYTATLMCVLHAGKGGAMTIHTSRSARSMAILPHINTLDTCTHVCPCCTTNVIEYA